MKKKKQVLCLEELNISEGYENREHITFKCQLKKGHEGRHKESGMQYDQRYTITWDTTGLRVRQ